MEDKQKKDFFNAVIEDDNFIRKVVDREILFGYGDFVLCTLKTEEEYNKEGRVKNTSHATSSVKHYPADKETLL